MLFVFPGLTYMTTFPPLFQPWPTAGKYHSTLFPTKPLSVSLLAGACVMSIAGSDPIDQPSTRVHIPSAGWKHWAYGWPRDSNPGPLRRKLSALPLWAIQTTQQKKLVLRHWLNPDDHQQECLYIDQTPIIIKYAWTLVKSQSISSRMLGHGLNCSNHHQECLGHGSNDQRMLRHG